MLFNDLLSKKGLDGVLVFRHTPWESQFKKVLPWLAGERPELFNAYQQTQGSLRVETDLLKARYAASFIGWDLGTASGDYVDPLQRPSSRTRRVRASTSNDRSPQRSHTALFIGLYQIGEHRPLTYEQFWQVPAYQELKNYGMQGFAGERDSVLWFDMHMTDFYRDWHGRLVVDWPPPPIRWWRWAHQAEFPVCAVLDLGPDMEPSEVISRESTWKDRLHTRWPEGLNDN